MVKLILFPFSLKGKRSMIQMNMLSDKMNKLAQSGLYRGQIVRGNEGGQVELVVSGVGKLRGIRRRSRTR